MKKSHIALALLLLVPAALVQAGVFLKSDDYEEGEEIVDVFLGPDDYAVMMDDFERRDQDFDWGWALTQGATGKGKIKEKHLKNLGFDIQSYSSVTIAPVENHAGIVKDEELQEIGEAWEAVFDQLGIDVVPQGGELLFESAIVDINREGGGFAFVKIEPFVEFEIRLRDTKNDRDLLLIREQEHNETPEGSAMDIANALVLFFR